MLLFFKKLITVCAFLFCGCINAFAQTETDASSLLSAEYNPRIIVIPFAKKQANTEEDLRKVWNEDFNKRIAVTKLKEAFDKKGVSTIDFAAKIEIIGEIRERNQYGRENFGLSFVERSGADVYVVVDVDTIRKIITDEDKPATKAEMIVTAYEVASGLSLSNKVCESPAFQTNDVGKLVSKAVESCAPEFIATIEQKWKNDILKFGRPVMLDFSFAKGSKNSMLSKDLNGLLYDEAIENIVKQNSVNRKYNVQISAKTKLFFNNVRVALSTADGNTYHVTEFAHKLIKDLMAAGIMATKEVRDNSVYILIDGN
jgi:Family of unknown function (DUF6175)